MGRYKKQIDDLDAVRIVQKALAPFGEDARVRILRWVAEKLEADPMQDGTSDEEPAAPRERKSRNRKKGAKQFAAENGGDRAAGTQAEI